ncbi:hypothetical protein BV898_03155 [Hypsibius exemplaris]|uniref:Uncharacterized protein n=1 Tax=Hypsibius exemplaris TaxID=2072580 RepID=A0A1W0X6V3_HYPEX|nr:hypothetical protein BV898_03155 [Hypsibius exemplaris]
MQEVSATGFEGMISLLKQHIKQEHAVWANLASTPGLASTIPLPSLPKSSILAMGTFKISSYVNESDVAAVVGNLTANAPAAITTLSANGAIPTPVVVSTTVGMFQRSLC